MLLLLKIKFRISTSVSSIQCYYKDVTCTWFIYFFAASQSNAGYDRPLRFAFSAAAVDLIVFFFEKYLECNIIRVKLRRCKKKKPRGDYASKFVSTRKLLFPNICFLLASKYLCQNHAISRKMHVVMYSKSNYKYYALF